MIKHMKTSSFYLAAYLLDKNHLLTNIDRSDLKNITFTFVKSDSLEIDLDIFWDNTNIWVQNYISAIKRLERYIKHYYV